MAKPAKPAGAKKEDAHAAEAPKSKKKLIIVAAVLISAIAGGAGWYFMHNKDAAHEVKVEAPKEPTFIPLEAFTVNLQHEEADQYLQIGITLKVMEPELTETVKAMLPEIRSKLNLLLSGKRPSELATLEGKKRLANEILIEANNALGIHNAPATHAPAAAPAPAPVVASEVEAASAPAEGEATAEAPLGDEAASAVAASAPPAAPEKKGVVDVLFTSFIIQ